MSPEEKKNARLGCAVVAVFVLLVGGCVNLVSGGDDEAKSVTTSAAESAATSAATSAAASVPDGSDATESPDASDASEEPSEAVTVPDYTGRNLQAAQDAAQRKGIYLLKSRDLSARNRMQVWDRNWQVCEQEPAAGSVMRDAETLTFAVVKTDESCDEPDTTGDTGGDGASGPTEEPTGAGGSVTSGGSSSSGGSAASGGSGGSGGSGADDGGSSGGSASSGGSGSSGGSASGGGGSSTSGGGAQAPAGASAQCNDGTYSYSRHRRGTCSHHHGVAVWLRSLPA
ncbi:DUF3761 domain-containing protein [Streptomyces angustmyceticus]|nr:DUF3761 domain-containing protein [Streptomyces angustmyceticus]